MLIPPKAVIAIFVLAFVVAFYIIIPAIEKLTGLKMNFYSFSTAYIIVGIFVYMVLGWFFSMVFGLLAGLAAGFIDAQGKDQ